MIGARGESKQGREEPGGHEVKLLLEPEHKQHLLLLRGREERRGRKSEMKYVPNEISHNLSLFFFKAR